jgi:hypothetical protein
MKNKLLLTLSLLIVMNYCHSALAATSSWAAKFAAAKGEVDKRQVCLDLIDAGELEWRTKLEKVQNLFGEWWTEVERTSDGSGYGIVWFGKSKTAPEKVQSLPSKWHLVIGFSADNRVKDYSLTNITK